MTAISASLTLAELDLIGYKAVPVGTTPDDTPEGRGPVIYIVAMVSTFRRKTSNSSLSFEPIRVLTCSEDSVKGLLTLKHNVHTFTESF